MDKVYILLNEIVKNENITQRELSKRVELSLGSVNILLNKMIHDGLVKIRQIPMNRVAYMLTPAGLAEMVKKTSNYIKFHYNYISETKEKIKNSLLNLNREYCNLFIIIDEDEIGELVRLTAEEMNMKYGTIEVVYTRELELQRMNENYEYTNNGPMEVNDGFRNTDRLSNNPAKYDLKNRGIIATSIETYNKLVKRQIKAVNLLERL